MSLANSVCWTYVFVPKRPFPKFDFRKTCATFVCVIKWWEVRMCCCFTTIYEKRTPGCTQMRPFHAEVYGPKRKCALNATRPAPEIMKQQLCALKSRNATHGFAHLLEPCNPIPGQNEQAGSEVCELAILMSSTKARQQTRQRITLTQCYTKAHKQQQADLFPSHPNFFWMFKCMLFVGSLFRTQRTFSKFGFVLHIRCPGSTKKRMPENI